MSHLTLHIVEELDICGLVHTCWMYPIERAMKVFKGYVRNGSRPEASMAEGYILDETIRFVTEYLQDFRHVRHRIWDVNVVACVLCLSRSSSWVSLYFLS
jgi:hypothetical protein